MDLNSALNTMEPREHKGWPFGDAPRVAQEYLEALRAGGQSLTTHSADFVKRSGISENSVVAIQHRTLTDIARLALSFDQVDAANSAALELLYRSIVRIETAVARSPKSPDFSGLDVMLISNTTEAGGAMTAKFSAWVADQQKSQATILKQSRLHREERTAEAKRRAKGGKATEGAE